MKKPTLLNNFKRSRQADNRAGPALPLLVFFLFLSSTLHAQTFTVESVIDGDTLKLTNGEEVQLIGVDASGKMGQPFDSAQGKEATEFVKGLIKSGDEVRMEFDVERKDKYGRLLGYIYPDL